MEKKAQKIKAKAKKTPEKDVLTTFAALDKCLRTADKKTQKALEKHYKALTDFLKQSRFWFEYSRIMNAAGDYVTKELMKIY